jgi:hypothetical protein
MIAVFERLSRSPTFVALAGACLGVLALAAGLHLHFGAVVVDGLWGYIGSAVIGALLALVIRYAVRKEYGWN